MNRRLISPITFLAFIISLNGSAQAPDVQIYGPHAEYVQPFFIKVYYNYITSNTPSWISEANADADATASIAYLNSVFNPHNIYIIGRNGLCGENQADIFVSTSNDAPGIRSNVPAAVHSDGIDLYIFQGSGVEGYAYGIPNTFLDVRGATNQNVLVTRTEVLAHELGHCLGLSHTFTGFSDGGCTQTISGCSSPCTCNGMDPGFCCGDYVKDTEINPYSGAIAVISGTCNPVPTDVTIATTKNFMSYVAVSECRSEFTEGQAKRMRAYLAEASLLQPVQPKTMINNPPSNITYWNTPQSPAANIRVPTGQTLVINATVTMSHNTSIYVEKGATLRVNALITAGCDQMWQGIIVAGDESLIQTLQNQGYVVVTSTGIIEHAVCGIRVQGTLTNGEPDDAGGGGIVLVSSGKFRNCITSVEYSDYIKQANKGKFFNAEFTVDKDFRGGNEKVKFASLSKNYGLLFFHNTFKDEREVCLTREDRAIGIHASNAGFTATSGCLFESLDFGIRVSKLTFDAGVFSIDGNTFTDCFTGIYAAMADGYRVSGNTFNLNRPDVCDNLQASQIVAIHAAALASNIQISNNTVNDAATEIATEVTYGTDCYGLGTKNNDIYKNHYDGIVYPNSATGINGTSSSEGMIYSGLLYECNTHVNTLEGDFWVTNGLVRGVQGEIVDGTPVGYIAAGNIFSGPNFRFKNNGVVLRYLSG